jgi:hypothetical protein
MNPDVDSLTNARQAVLKPTGSLFNEIPLQLHLEMRGSDAHWDVHYAIYARSLASGLRPLGDGERNVHLFTPAEVVGSDTG